MRIDSHQHFWAYNEQQYPWIPKDSPLHHDWLPADLARLQTPLGLNGSIAVQARQTLEESRWLLKLADDNPVIRGVVGWVDLRADHVEDDLADLVHHPKFRGVRHVVQDEPDEQFMLKDEFTRGISRLHQFGLTYDILIYEKQLPAAIELVRRFPQQSFVLDHIAKPRIRDGSISPWRERIHQLAEFPNVFCKVSGLITEADHKAWTSDQLRPYLDVVVGAFGPNRLMWGSDWPVCLLAGSYARVFRVMEEYVHDWSAEDQAGFFGENAARFYRLPA